MPTATAIVEIITHNVTGLNPQRTCDTFKAGDPKAPVRGIVVTWMATRAVLTRAVELNANFVITHEPTFYQDERLADIAGDPVYESKKAFAAEHDLIIWRCHDTVHLKRPDVIVAGMTRALAWQAFARTDQPELFDLPRQTLGELTAAIKHCLHLSAVRVTGEPSLAVGTVAMSVGCNSWDNQRKLLRQPGVDVLVCGEVREWETCEYVRDSAATPRPQGLIVLGHANSEEAGMDYFAQWLDGRVAGLPVHFVPAGDPFRTL